MRTNIKNFTPRNYNIIVNALMSEKHYSVKIAEKIARQLFDTLAANPGGNIWSYYDHIITAEENTLREIARRCAKEAMRDKVIISNLLSAVSLDGSTREKAEKLLKYVDRGIVTYDELFLMAMGYYGGGENETC